MAGGQVAEGAALAVPVSSVAEFGVGHAVLGQQVAELQGGAGITLFRALAESGSDFFVLSGVGRSGGERQTWSEEEGCNSDYFKEVLNKSFDRLRTNGQLLIPFVVMLSAVEASNHERNPFIQRFLNV